MCLSPCDPDRLRRGALRRGERRHCRWTLQEEPALPSSHDRRPSPGPAPSQALGQGRGHLQVDPAPGAEILAGPTERPEPPGTLLGGLPAAQSRGGHTGAGDTWLQFLLCSLFTMRSWTSHFITLGFRVLLCKVKVTQSCLIFATPWIIQSMEFSRPEYWSR